MLEMLLLLMQGTSNIPVIDLSCYREGSLDTKNTANSIREACKSVGFFYIKNHGVPEELINSIFQNSKKFFNLTQE
jgi:isopenicillin N synthase-like dioxygenase